MAKKYTVGDAIEHFLKKTGFKLDFLENDRRLFHEGMHVIIGALSRSVAEEGLTAVPELILFDGWHHTPGAMREEVQYYAHARKMVDMRADEGHYYAKAAILNRLHENLISVMQELSRENDPRLTPEVRSQIKQQIAETKYGKLWGVRADGTPFASVDIDSIPRDLWREIDERVEKRSLKDEETLLELSTLNGHLNITDNDILWHAANTKAIAYIFKEKRGKAIRDLTIDEWMATPLSDIGMDMIDTPDGDKEIVTLPILEETRPLFMNKAHTRPAISARPAPLHHPVHGG